VSLWSYFIWTGSVSTIWPMFGTANQLLAAVALAVATSAIINTGKTKYAWVTFLPMLFVSVTTLTACWLNIFNNFLPLAAAHPEKTFQAYLNVVVTVVIMVSAVVILWESFRRWYLILVKKKHPKAIHDKAHREVELADYGCC
jgi:carbon starvation protein